MPLFTPREAARRLGVSYPTLKQWIYKGSVRTSRTAGGHYRIAESEIDRLSAGAGRPARAARTAPRAAAGVIVALSGRNQLRGLVEEVRTDGLLAQVRLRIGGQRLTAVITRDAATELKLTRGDEALAVIKATEVMIARDGPPPDARWPRARRRTAQRA
ncbi:MAG TPA: helix-turn-helix transcriptional regulator [Vicinamibacterales bacterium]|nr:helix-turn-helix transcriptional regulator [Vicinamibacterales bacterium]